MQAFDIAHIGSSRVSNRRLRGSARRWAALATLAVGAVSVSRGWAGSQDISWDPDFAAAGGGVNVDYSTWSSTNQNWVYFNGPQAGQPTGWNSAQNNYALFPVFAGSGTPGAKVYTASESLTMSNLRFVGNNITVGATGSGMLTITATGSATANSTLASGYVLGGTIRTDVGVTTLINAPIYAPQGLQKVDSGVLVLGGTNNISGIRSMDGTYNVANVPAHQAVNFMVGYGTNLFGENSGYVQLASDTALQSGISIGIGNGILDLNGHNITVNNLRFTNWTGSSAGGLYDTNLGLNAGIGGAGTVTVTGVISGSAASTLAGGYVAMVASTVDMNGGNLKVANPGDGIIFTKPLQNGSLTVTYGPDVNSSSTSGFSAGTGVQLYGNNTYTGPTLFNAGVVGNGFTVATVANLVTGSNQSSDVTVVNSALSLRGANGSYGAANSVKVFAGGLLILDNTAATNLSMTGDLASQFANAPSIASAQNNNRLSDTVAISLRDSSMTILGSSAATASETIGSFTAANGRNILTLTPGTGGSLALNLGGNLTVSNLATLNVTATTLGGSSKVFVGGTVSPSPTAGGLIPRVVNGTNFVRYDPTLGLVPVTVLQSTLVANDNVNLSANTTVAATTSINALKLGLTSAVSLTIPASTTLTVNSGMLLTSSSGATILGAGTLAFGGTPGAFFGTYTVSSAMTGTAGFITDNGTITLAGDMSGLTGTVTMNGGTISLANNTAANVFAVRSGTLRYIGTAAFSGSAPIILGSPDNGTESFTSSVGSILDVSAVQTTNSFITSLVAGQVPVLRNVVSRNIVVDNGGLASGNILLTLASGTQLGPSIAPLSQGRTYRDASNTPSGVVTNTYGTGDTGVFSGNFLLNSPLRMNGGLNFSATIPNQSASEFTGAISGTSVLQLGNGQWHFTSTSSLTNAGGIVAGVGNGPARLVFDGVAGNLPLTFGNNQDTVTWSSNTALPSGPITIQATTSQVFIPMVTGMSFTNQINFLAPTFATTASTSIIFAPPLGVDLFFNGSVIGNGTVVKAGAGNVIFPTGFNVPISLASGTLSPNPADSSLPDQVTVTGTGVLDLKGLTVGRNGTQNIDAIGGFVSNGTLIGNAAITSTYTGGEGLTSLGTAPINPVISAKLSGGLSFSVLASVNTGNPNTGGFLNKNAVVTLSGTNDYSGPTTLLNATVRADVGTNIPLGGHIKLTNSVLEGAPAYNVTLGLGAGQVELIGASGFGGWNADTNAVHGTTVTVNGGSQLVFGFNFTDAYTPGLNPLGMTLQSPSANQPVTLTNDIELNDPSATGRTFNVLVGSNPATGSATAAAIATLSGVISGDNAMLIKQSYGILALTGVNTYTGPTKVFGGSLRFTDGVGLPTASALIVSGGGSIQPDITVPFVRPVNNNGGGIALAYETNNYISKVNDFQATSGFDAVNPVSNAGATPLTVAIYSEGHGTNAAGPGDHGTVIYSGSQFNTKYLAFNASPAANAPLVFHSNLDMDGGSLGIIIGTGSATGNAGTTTFTGSIINSTPNAATALTKTGPGTMVLAGNANNLNGGTLFVNAGTLALAPGAAVTGNVWVVSGGTTNFPVFGNVGNSGTFDFTGAGSTTLTTVANQTITYQGVTPKIIGGYNGVGTIQFYNSNAATSSSPTSNVQLINSVSNAITGSINFSKIGVGVTEMSNSYTYSGITYIAEGPLRAQIGAGGLPANSPIVIRNGGEFQTGGSFTANLGTGPGQVSFPSSTGAGFDTYTNYAAGGLTVAIGGTSAPTGLTLGTANFSPAALTFNKSIQANGPITFANPVDLAGNSLAVFNATGSAIGTAGTTTFTGSVTDSVGNSALTKLGPGNLVLTKTGAGAYSWPGGVINIGNPTGIQATNIGSIFMGAGTTTTNSVVITPSTSQSASSQSVFNIVAAGPLTTVAGQSFTLVGAAANLSGTFTGVGQVNIAGSDSAGSTRGLSATLTGSVGLALIDKPGSSTHTATTVSMTGTYVSNGPISLSGGGNAFPTFTSGNAIIFNGPVIATTGAASLTIKGRANTALFQVPASTNGYTTVAKLSSISMLNDTGYTNSPFGRIVMNQTDRTTAKAEVLITGSLDLSPVGATFTGFMDVGNNDLIITGGNGSFGSLTGIRNMVKAWYNNGSINSVGLGSTVPGAGVSNTMIAVFANDAGDGVTPFYSSYDGVTGLTAQDAIIKFTNFGDTNIDGIVNGVDLANAIEGLSTGLTGWQNGDINYDGVVDVADISKIVAMMNTGGLTNYGNGQGGTDTGGGQVPEPSGLAVVLLAAPLLTRRRRK